MSFGVLYIGPFLQPKLGISSDAMETFCARMAARYQSMLRLVIRPRRHNSCMLQRNVNVKAIDEGVVTSGIVKSMSSTYDIMAPDAASLHGSIMAAHRGK